MITALEQFEKCLPEFSEASWIELSLKIGNESLPTWNEISSVKEKLQQIIKK